MVDLKAHELINQLYRGNFALYDYNVVMQKLLNSGLPSELKKQVEAGIKLLEENRLLAEEEQKQVYSTVIEMKAVADMAMLFEIKEEERARLQQTVHMNTPTQQQQVLDQMEILRAKMQAQLAEVKNLNDDYLKIFAKASDIVKAQIKYTDADANANKNANSLKTIIKDYARDNHLTLNNNHVNQIVDTFRGQEKLVATPMEVQIRHGNSILATNSQNLPGPQRYQTTDRLHQEMRLANEFAKFLHKQKNPNASDDDIPSAATKLAALKIVTKHMTNIRKEIEGELPPMASVDDLINRRVDAELHELATLRGAKTKCVEAEKAYNTLLNSTVPSLAEETQNALVAKAQGLSPGANEPYSQATAPRPAPSSTRSN